MLVGDDAKSGRYTTVRVDARCGLGKGLEVYAKRLFRQTTVPIAIASCKNVLVFFHSERSLHLWGVYTYGGSYVHTFSRVVKARRAVDVFLQRWHEPTMFEVGCGTKLQGIYALCGVSKACLTKTGSDGNGG